MRIQRRETRIIRALAVALAVLACFAAPAPAEVEWLSSFGASGRTGGAFKGPASVAINHSTGDVYVADRQNNRIQEFTRRRLIHPAWGFDVVASGEDDKPFANEVQRIQIKASTAPSNSISREPPPPPSRPRPKSKPPWTTSMSGFGGGRDGHRGARRLDGSNPYLVTFRGILAGEEMPPISSTPPASGSRSARS